MRQEIMSNRWNELSTNSQDGNINNAHECQTRIMKYNECASRANLSWEKTQLITTKKGRKPANTDNQVRLASLEISIRGLMPLGCMLSLSYAAVWGVGRSHWGWRGGGREEKEGMASDAGWPKQERHMKGRVRWPWQKNKQIGFQWQQKLPFYYRKSVNGTW